MSDIRERWPLHFLVWNNDSSALYSALQTGKDNLEQVDPRGRTPLHLAVTLQYVKCAQVLLNHGASTLATNRHHWNVCQEAICTGNLELVALVHRYRDEQLATANRDDVPVMLAKLKSTPDFYIEMTWKFSSWVPLVSRLCPSDTYKIWKKGTNVRVDTTLIGFERMGWLRGALSFIFKISDNGERIVSQINHDRGTVFTRLLQNDSSPMPSYEREAEISQKMQSPVVTTYINTDTIAFKKQKSLWGSESHKTETICGHKAKVFNATGLDIITKTRMEHVPEAKRPSFKSSNPLQNLLGTSNDDGSANVPDFLDVPQIEEATPSVLSTATLEKNLSIQEYFQEPKDSNAYDSIGRAVVENTQVQPLKAKVYLADDYPLSLQDQIMPIIDLMAQNNAHFAKLKDFITLQIPSGFPVKIEIPLFRVMTATVTFDNVNGCAGPTPFVSSKVEHIEIESEPIPPPSSGREGGLLRRRGRESGRHEEQNSDMPFITSQRSTTSEVKDVCVVSDECFAIPVGYREHAQGYSQLASEEDDQLQQAIRLSLLDQAGTNSGEGEPKLTFREMLNDRPAAQDQDLTRAIQASLQPRQTAQSAPPVRIDSDLELALALSQAQVAEDERRRQQEDEELRKVLELSLLDK